MSGADNPGGFQGAQAGDHNVQINYYAPVAGTSSAGAPGGDGNARNKRKTERGRSKGKRKSLSPAKATIWAAIITALGTTLGVILAPLISEIGSASNTRTDGLPTSPPHSTVAGKPSVGTSPSAHGNSSPGADPAKTSNSPTGTTGLPKYQDQEFALGGDGCNDTYIYRYVIFGQQRLVINNLGTSSALSSLFGVELFCSPNSNGGVFDPNLQYGGQAATLTGGADFASCYSRIMNSPTENITQFDQLRPGFHLCIFYPQYNELALVTLRSVSQTSYRVAGTVTVWKVLTRSN